MAEDDERLKREVWARLVREHPELEDSTLEWPKPKPHPLTRVLVFGALFLALGTILFFLHRSGVIEPFLHWGLATGGTVLFGLCVALAVLEPQDRRDVVLPLLIGLLMIGLGVALLNEWI